MIDFDKSILGETLVPGTRLEGAIENNRGLDIEITTKVTIGKTPTTLKLPFIIHNTGEGPNSIYLEMYAQSGLTNAPEIIHQVKEKFKVDLSSTFNTAFLNLKEEKYEEPELKKLSNLFLKISELRFSSGYNNEISFLRDIALITLIIDLKRKGVEYSLEQLRFISRNPIERIKNIDKLQGYGKFMEAKFFSNLFKNLNDTLKHIDWLWEGEKVIQNAYSKYPERTQFLISDITQNFFLKSRRDITHFSNSELMDYILTSFVNLESYPSSIYDPAVGSGNSLIKVRNAFPSSQRPPLLRASEFNQTAYFFAGLNLILNDIAVSGLKLQDSLEITNSEKFDLITCVPPVGGRVETSYKKRERSEDAFIHHIIYALSYTGEAHIMIPVGFLFRRSVVKEQLINQNILDAVIELPSIDQRISGKWALLILKKNRERKEIFTANIANHKFTLRKAEKGYVDFLGELTLCNAAYHLWNKKQNIKKSQFFDFFNTQFFVKNKFDILPSKYIFEGRDKLNKFLSEEDIYPLGNFIANHFQFHRNPKTYHNNLVPCQLIKGKDIVKSNEKFIFKEGVSDDKFYAVDKSKILDDNNILVSTYKIEESKIFKKRDEKDYSVGAGVLALVPFIEKIIPEYLIHQLQSEFSKLQLERIGRVTAMPKYTLRQILELKIKVPSLEEQLLIVNKINRPLATEVFPENYLKASRLWSESYLPLPTPVFSKEYLRANWRLQETFSHYGEPPLVKALKHYVNNWIVPTSTYLNLIKNFIQNQSVIETNLWEEKISSNGDLKVGDTFLKVESFIKDIGEITTKIEKLYKLDEHLKFETKSLNKILTDLGQKYNHDFGVNVIGDRVLMPLNEFCLSTIVENLLSNFIKHGDIENIIAPRVEFEIIKNEEEETVEILYKNNGNPFPETFNFDDLINVDKRAGKNAGLGLGGNLISKAIKKHNGNIEPISLHEVNASGWNVIFKITLNR